jgi:hypothetical protein
MKVWLAVAILAVIVLTVFFGSHRATSPPEPSFGGRTLSEWGLLNPNALTDNPKSLEAREALRRIGTNALPCLLAWLAADPNYNPLRRAAEWVVIRLPNRLIPQRARDWALSDPVLFHFELASAIFKVLGANAEPAIPDLERVASDPRGRRSAYLATYILGGIGPHALPALQRIARNAACPTHNEANEEAEGLLAQSLFRSSATNALKAIDPEAATRAGVN